jgi:hypothetical protein
MKSAQMDTGAAVVKEDGGVISLGDAAFYGSTGRNPGGASLELKRFNLRIAREAEDTLRDAGCQLINLFLPDPFGSRPELFVGPGMSRRYFR